MAPIRVRPHKRNDPTNEDFTPGNLDIITGSEFEAVVQTATIKFDMEQASSDTPGKSCLRLKMVSDANNIGGNEIDGHYIAVKPGEAWKIKFELSPSWDWEFDPNEPISFKFESDVSNSYLGIFRSEKNYSVVSTSQNSTNLLITSVHKPGAHIPSTDLGNCHPFNIYIRVSQSGIKKNPIRIDPDVKNPPPGGNAFNKIVPAGTPVFI